MVYNIDDVQLTYEQKYWKLKKIYLKLVQHHGSSMLENVWLQEDIKSLEQEYKKIINTWNIAQKNSDELMNIIDDFILTIDKAVEQYPDLEKLFEDNTDWYKDLAKHT